MDQEKFVQLQRQMRLNNEDYKDFLDDIDSWSTKMKEKETDISKSNVKTNDLPRIRNSSNDKTPKPKPAKIKAYDYKSWDKFDVDKALEDCDKPDKVEEQKEDVIFLSNQYKDTGNVFFKEGNYTKAIEEYTIAIQYNSNSDVLYTNRAMSFIKLENYQSAELDCCQALQINSNSVKALYRRSKCRTALNKRQDALEDLKTVLKIEPNNKLAFKEMKELERELNIRGVVEPLEHPLKDRQSNKPLARIEIIDVDPNKHFESISNDQHNVEDSDEKKMKEIQAVSESIKFKLPQTSVQLVKDLCNFRKNPKHLANYVAALDYKTFKRLLGHALDSELLLDLVNGFSLSLKYKLIEQGHFVDGLNYLYDVSRFSTSWTMISDEEKISFREAISMIDQGYFNKLRFSN